MGKLTTQPALVIGRGQLFFGQFAPGTRKTNGERYLGNTSGFSLTRDLDQVDQFTSYNGQKIKQRSHITAERHSANVITDNVTMKNVALWYDSEVDATGQRAVGILSETFTVERGLYYQLGSDRVAGGAKHVEPDITFTKNGAPVSVDGNLSLDRPAGRFAVFEDAVGIEDGDELVVRYQWRSSPSTSTSPRAVETLGTLRFIATNPVGPKKHYFFPCVRISAVGNIDLKGDQWQQFGWNIDIRRLNAGTEAFYVQEGAAAEYTEDEQALIELGPVNLSEFPYWEDRLHTIINVDVPEADYDAPITYP